MTEQPIKQRRRKIVVDKTFQYKYVAVILLMVVIFININLTIPYVLVNVETFSNPIRDWFGTRTAFGAIFYILAVTDVLGLIVVFLVALRTSHRVAGPLFGIKKCLRGIGLGNLYYNHRVRDRDEFKDLADAVNTMLSGLRERTVKVKGASEVLIDLTGKIQDKLDQQQAKELADAATRLRESLDGLKVTVPADETTERP